MPFLKITLQSSVKVAKYYPQFHIIFRNLITTRNLVRNYENSLKNYQSYLKKPQTFSNNFRTIITSNNLASNYEGDGKTTVTILNREYKYLIMINSYSSVGFRLSNGIYALGPLAAFPRTVLQWNINSMEELTPESFSLFCLLDPKIDILVLGTGDVRRMPGKEILEFLQSSKIAVEILPTDQAVSLFNFLNAEGRCVAGAFIPPTSVIMYDEELKLINEGDFMEMHITRPSKKIEE